MVKMMTYSEANQVLGSSLTPNNKCLAKATAIANGADESLLTSYSSNRLVPASAVQPAQHDVIEQFFVAPGGKLVKEITILMAMDALEASYQTVVTVNGEILKEWDGSSKFPYNGFVTADLVDPNNMMLNQTNPGATFDSQTGIWTHRITSFNPSGIDKYIQCSSNNRFLFLSTDPLHYDIDPIRVTFKRDPDPYALVTPTRIVVGNTDTSKKTVTVRIPGTWTITPKYQTFSELDPSEFLKFDTTWYQDGPGTFTIHAGSENDTEYSRTDIYTIRELATGDTFEVLFIQSGEDLAYNIYTNVATDVYREDTGELIGTTSTDYSFGGFTYGLKYEAATEGVELPLRFGTSSIPGSPNQYGIVMTSDGQGGYATNRFGGYNTFTSVAKTFDVAVQMMYVDVLASSVTWPTVVAKPMALNLVSATLGSGHSTDDGSQANGASSDESWLTITRGITTRLGGKAVRLFTISMTENTTGQDRTADITFTHRGNVNTIMTVKQLSTANSANAYTITYTQQNATSKNTKGCMVLGCASGYAEAGQDVYLYFRNSYGSILSTPPKWALDTVNSYINVGGINQMSLANATYVYPIAGANSFLLDSIVYRVKATGNIEVNAKMECMSQTNISYSVDENIIPVESYGVINPYKYPSALFTLYGENNNSKIMQDGAQIGGSFTQDWNTISKFDFDDISITGINNTTHITSVPSTNSQHLNIAINGAESTAAFNQNNASITLTSKLQS